MSSEPEPESASETFSECINIDNTCSIKCIEELIEQIKEKKEN